MEWALVLGEIEAFTEVRIKAEIQTQCRDEGPFVRNPIIQFGCVHSCLFRVATSKIQSTKKSHSLGVGSNPTTNQTARLLSIYEDVLQFWQIKPW